MTGAASPGERVLSAVSLALFADSGWYDVDMSGAEPLAWGSGAGRAARWKGEEMCPVWAGTPPRAAGGRCRPRPGRAPFFLREALQEREAQRN